MHFVKKSFLSRLILFFLLIINFIYINQSHSANSVRPDIIRKPITIGEYFNGEAFTYNIGFWWFKKAATGKISINRLSDGNYKIMLEAETMGFIGFITKHRKDIYTTYAEEWEAGKRLRATRVEKIVRIGNKIREGYTIVDYNKRTYRWKSWGNEQENKETEEPLPVSGYYDDPLTGFYNFRFGVYGAVKEGKEFNVPTFPRKGVSTIPITIATNKEKAARLNPDHAEADYLADIVIDKELFGSQTGKVEVQFSKELIPIQATAKDLLVFGDVKGVLIEMTSAMGFKKGREDSE
jgi:hypothetical protein